MRELVYKVDLEQNENLLQKSFEPGDFIAAAQISSSKDNYDSVLPALSLTGTEQESKPGTSDSSARGPAVQRDSSRGGSEPENPVISHPDGSLPDLVMEQFYPDGSFDVTSPLEPEKPGDRPLPRTETNRYRPDGSLQYREERTGDTNTLTQRSNYRTDGSLESREHFSVLGDGRPHMVERYREDGSLAERSEDLDRGRSVTRFNTDGSRVQEIRRDDGSISTWTFQNDRVREYRVAHADGSSSRSSYNNNGTLARLETRTADGTLSITTRAENGFDVREIRMLNGARRIETELPADMIARRQGENWARFVETEYFSADGIRTGSTLHEHRPGSPRMLLNERTYGEDGRLQMLVENNHDGTYTTIRYGSNGSRTVSRGER